jgi:hypothetical protein
MPADEGSMTVLPSHFGLGGKSNQVACVWVFPPNSNVTKGLEYKFSFDDVTTYSVEDEAGAAASVQVTFDYGYLVTYSPSSSSTTTTKRKPTPVTPPKSA